MPARLSRSRSGKLRLAERARMVLACPQGRRNGEIASEMGLRPRAVGHWRQRFAASGTAGLRDKAKSIKPAKFWFGILLRRTLSGVNFRSVEQLVEVIHASTMAYNPCAVPFMWCKPWVRAAQLRNAIVNSRN